MQDYKNKVIDEIEEDSEFYFIYDEEDYVFFETTEGQLIIIERTSSSYYEDGLVIQLKANVTPANATNSAVKVSYDSEIAEITVVDSVFININVKEDGALDFSVVSTDGLDLTINATLLVLYA